MEYILYHTTNGCITGTLTCPPEMLAANLAAQGAGIGAVVSPSGQIDPMAYQVVDGAIVEHAFVRPSPRHQWIPAEGGWVDRRTLAQAKADKWDDIKRARADAINAHLPTPFGLFQAGPDERQNITDAVMLAQTLAAAGQPVAITWTLADNTVATLSLQQLVTVGLLLGQKVQAAHARARERRLLIEAATTMAEVDAVSW